MARKKLLRLCQILWQLWHYLFLQLRALACNRWEFGSRDNLFSYSWQATEVVAIYIQPSPFEGCCNSLGKAISNGKFILISDTDYFAERIKEKFPQCVLTSLCRKEIDEDIENYIRFIESQNVCQALADYSEIVTNLHFFVSFCQCCLRFVNTQSGNVFSDSFLFRCPTNCP